MLEVFSMLYFASSCIFFILSCLWVVWYAVNKLLDMFSHIGQGEGRHALITGCDSGFGYLAAQELNRRGVVVFAACLTPQGVKMYEEDDTFKGSAFQMDITKTEDIERATQLIQSVVKDKGLDLLFNNAGIVYFGPIDWLSVQHYRRVLDVNLLGHLNVTKSTLPMLKAARGRIINTASVFGRVTLPYYSAYHVSKYALEALSDGLRHELKMWGVSVHLIEPGLTRTALYKEADQQLRSLWDNQPDEIQTAYGEDFFKNFVGRMNTSNADGRAADANGVLDAYIHAGLSTRPKSRYLVGADAHLLAYTIGVLPTSVGDYLLGMLQWPIIP